MSTLMLAVVAFQYVISSTMPNVPYMTLADKYTVFCFVVVLGVAAQTSVVGWRGDGVQADGQTLNDSRDKVRCNVALDPFKPNPATNPC